MQIFRRHKKSFHEIVSAILMIAVVAATFTFTFPVKQAQAATYYMTQDSWSGGASASTFAHPFSTSTNIYYSSVTNASGGSNIQLDFSSVNFTDSVTPSGSGSATGGDFDNGILSNAAIDSPNIVLDANSVTWTQATSSANWAVRLDFGAVVYNNKMWVMGGGIYSNDVWWSTDGITWTQATASAGWISRIGHRALVYNNKMWVIGGVDNLDNLLNDVWWSTDGITWTQATSSANWAARSDFGAVVYNNKMWVTGGNSGSGNNNVWWSTDGITWTQATSSAAWQARQNLGLTVFNNEMWIMGGYNNSIQTKNDVWHSSDGITWTQATSSANWSARYGMASVVFNNKLWVVGGQTNPASSNTKVNDVWYSSNGSTWTQATSGANWSARRHHGTVVYNNKMWIMGGIDNNNTNLKDVWYTPLVSSGTFESATIDFGFNSNFNTISWNATTTNAQSSCTQTTGAGCAIKIQLASSNSASGPWTYYGPDGTTGSYYTQQAGETIWSGHNSSRYFRHKIYLNTTNILYTPTISSITINYPQYYTSSNLVSSKYDAGNNANLVDRINWTETSTSTTETVKFQIRTASSAAGLDSATWCGPTVCNGNEYFSSPSSTKNVSVASNHPMKSGGDDQWFQYRVIMASGGGVTPIVDDVVITYVVNAAPNFDSAFGTNGILINQIATSTDADWGKILIQHRAEDIDTASGTTPFSVSTTFAYRLLSTDAWTAISNLTPSRANRDIAGSYITTSTIWDAKSQISQVYSTTTQIKVTLYDGEAANHTASSTSVAFTLDTKNPATGAVYAKIDSSGTNDVLTLNISDDSNIQYRISNNSNFSNDSNIFNGNSVYDWYSVGASSTTATSTWTLPVNSSGNEEVVYYNTRDVYGNSIGTSTIVAPGIGSNISNGIIIKDVSNISTNLWDEFISWVPFTATSGAAFSSYQLYRSTDGTNYSNLTTITNSATNYYRDTGLSSSTTYYYKVRFADTNGDISQFSNVVFDKPDGSGGTDITPPVISNVASSEVQSVTAKITWTADKLSDSRVIYGTTSDSYPSSTYVSTWISDNGTHTVYLTGLAPSTTYYYKASSRDPYGNSATSSKSNFTTLSGPQISNVSCSNSADNSIVVIWNTNATTTSSYVDYSTNSNLSGYLTKTLSSETFTESSAPYQHKTEIIGLSQTTTYYLRVGSTVSGVTTVDNNSGNFYICKTTKDAKPPVISNILTPVKSDTAIVVTWDTDEPASSQIFYDTSSKSSVSDYASYTTETTSPLTRTHVVSLTGLTKETRYYFRVRSRDMNPDSGYAASSEQTATTTAEGKTIYVYIGTSATTGSASDSTSPSITDLKISNIGSFNATIDFNVSENATAFLEYGQTADYGFTAGSSDFKTTHSVKLSSLKMGTDYKLRVKAIDKAGNSSYSEQQAFKTKYFTESVKELVALEGASNFQDAIEDAIESVLPSIVPPFIEKPEVADITENSAVVKWKTNVSAYSVVVYSSEKDYDTLKINPYSGESSDTDNKKISHEINLLGLSSNTKYHYMAKSFVLPQAVGKSNDLTFVTKAARIKPKIADIDNDAIRIIWTTDKPASSIIEYKNLRTGEIDKKIREEKIVEHDVKIENLIPDTAYEITVTGYGEDNNLIEAGEAITVRTSRDVAAPTITGLKIDGALVPGRNDRVQTVVSWRTNEPANSVVEYGEGSGGAEEELKDRVGDSDVYSENHNIILSKLKPGTLYRMRVISIDDAGNKTASPVRTIITPRQSESIVDVIVKNFEDTFQFLRKIK